MKERPILFSAPMVRALLAGTKTQTRRIVKPQPPVEFAYLDHVDDHGAVWCDRDDDSEDTGHWPWSEPTVVAPMRCPYGIAGDRLWVRETYAVHGEEHYGQGTGYTLQWRADEATRQFHFDRRIQPLPDHPWSKVCNKGWKPSIHMPRWASRITLEIIDVRVQRLQDIGTDDILAEGVRIPAADDGSPLIGLSGEHSAASFLTEWGKRLNGISYEDMLRAEWASLWSTINGRESWDANPWVWAVSFKRVNA